MNHGSLNVGNALWPVEANLQKNYLLLVATVRLFASSCTVLSGSLPGLCPRETGLFTAVFPNPADVSVCHPWNWSAEIW